MADKVFNGNTGAEEREIVSNVMELIDECPTSYHVVKRALELIDSIVLREEDAEWDIEPGKTYCVTRNDSSAVFVHVPQEADGSRPARFEIAAVHGDSPGYAVKNAPIKLKDGYVTLNVEEYGSPIRSTFFDRPLSLAGRVCARDSATRDVSCYLVDLRDEIGCVIPSLAPHMGGKDEKESVQKEMMPVIGTEGSYLFPETALAEAVCAHLKDRYGAVCDIDGILSYDLFAYCTQFPVKSGNIDSPRALVCSPRLDDQGCAWAAVEALIRTIEWEKEIGGAARGASVTGSGGGAGAGAEAQSPDDKRAGAVTVPVLAIFDNEENGSGGYHAASSTFLSDVLSRIYREALCPARTPDKEASLSAALARSFMLSADNGHASHPNYEQAGDPTNKVTCGDGVVLKVAADQRYMSGARVAASFIDMCGRGNIPYQVFHKNSDVDGGQTLGNISARQVSVPGCDIGLAQLAMHSAYETCAANDIYSLYRAFCAFFGGGRDGSIVTSDIVCY